MHRRVGDALHFGYVFHWMYMRRVIADDSRPRQSGLPLSHRERDCIKYAAHGMTSADIGHKLGITERTVNFHFSNAITKLGVLNRHEAIASAVAQRLIRFESMGDAKRSAYFASRRPQRHRRRR
jgi:LuxR family quorum-sensing transcriptional regulator LasR